MPSPTWFATLLRAAGADVPADWVIDGIDQLAQLVGPQDSFGRELVVLALCLSKPVSDAQGASIGGVRNDKRSSP